MRGKQGKANWIIIALVAVAIWALFGMPGAEKIGFGKTSSDAGKDSGSGSTGTAGLCGKEDVSLTPKMTRLGKAGTSLSTASYNYFVITDKIGSVSAASATTVSTEKEYQIMFGENSTAYYTKVQTVNTGCEDPKYVTAELAFADTSLATFYIENSDGTVNAASVAEAMGASDTAELTAYMKASTDEYFGNPDSTCQNVGVIEYDKTYILSASGDNPTAVPGFFTYFNSSYDGSAAFFIPKTADGAKVSFNIKVETTGTQPDGTLGSMSPRLTVYDCDIDKDEDSLALIHGVEDEDLNMLSLANQTVTLTLS